MEKECYVRFSITSVGVHLERQECNQIAVVPLSGSISRPEDSTNDLASPLTPTAQQAAITVVDDKIEGDRKCQASQINPGLTLSTWNVSRDLWNF